MIAQKGPPGWPAATGRMQSRAHRRRRRKPNQADGRQLGLFAHVPRVQRPADADIEPLANQHQTSRSAAKRIKPAAATQRQRVLDCIRESGTRGRTDEEIQLALGLRVQTETPRRGELCKLGLVVDSGIRRPTSSGRLAVVWRAVPIWNVGGDRG